VPKLRPAKHEALLRDAVLLFIAAVKQAGPSKMGLAETGRFGFNSIVPAEDVFNQKSSR